ncbi:MAG: hypothetical protein A2297_07310 [Elusimicrobia bacterium RIFOXYB2_FULL_48_7]|nr:MAG: hypothetical protein A2297_07310 [Elusimicrobia bacterium RIFOXYB2_FULL_48_7]
MDNKQMGLLARQILQQFLLLAHKQDWAVILGARQVLPLILPGMFGSLILEIIVFLNIQRHQAMARLLAWS